MSREDGFEDSYRYESGLWIRHPTTAPEEISAALGMEPQISWLVGTVRKTTTGARLPGLARDTYWNFSEDVDGDRLFSKGVLRLVETLEGCRDFVLRFSETGGTISIKISLPGSINIGDRVGWDLLKRLADLRVSLDIEVFPGMRLPGDEED